MWESVRSLPFAVMSCVIYMGLSYVFAPHFPFAVVSMYNHMADHHQGAVPAFLIEGKVANVKQVDRIQGIPDAAFNEKGIPNSMGYALDHIHYYVTEHTVPDTDPPGPVNVAFGWRRFRISDTGVVEEPVQVIASGTAHWVKP